MSQQQYPTQTRAQAAARLEKVQAQMFILGEEAKQLAAFLNGAAQEDQEFNAIAEKQMQEQKAQAREQEAAALQGQADVNEQEAAQSQTIKPE